MGKWIRSIFLLVLCVMVSCGGRNIAGNRYAEGEKGVWTNGGRKNSFYFYDTSGKTMEINAVTYSIVVKEGAENSGEEHKIAIMRVTRK